MSTQGIVSLTRDGKTLIKWVAGCNGMRAPDLAEALQRWVPRKGRPSIEQALDLALVTAFGGQGGGTQCGCLTVVTEDRIENIDDGDMSTDPGYARYRETFPDPFDNPRWEHHIADYQIAVDMNTGTITKH